MLSSLRDRLVNHKFHYVSYKQAHQWRELFKRYSPFMSDPACRRIYEESCVYAARQLASPGAHVIGLGCGSGEKDLRLLEQLRSAGRTVIYTPADVSMPLVVTAQTLAEDAGFRSSAGVVCDLQAPMSLAELAPELGTFPTIVTFFGMIPNFEPTAILPNISRMARSGDVVILSANLAPGHDYETGMREVLPQYHNPATEAWLLTFLLDLGIARGDGAVRWVIETDSRYPALQRLGAYFRFQQRRSILVENQEFSFHPGDDLRLFFSYRYSIEGLQAVLADHGFGVRQTFAIAEEVVLLCEKN